MLLDTAKAFDTVWVDDRVYKLTSFNFASYLVKSMSYYLRARSFETLFYAATFCDREMRGGMVQGGLISIFLFSLYVNDMPTSSKPLVLYTDDMAIIATSASSTARQLPRVLTHRPRTVADRMEDRHQLLDEHRDGLQS